MSHSEHLLLLLMLLLHNAETIVKGVVTLILGFIIFMVIHNGYKTNSFFSPFKTILSRQARFYEVVLKTGSDKIIHWLGRYSSPGFYYVKKTRKVWDFILLSKVQYVCTFFDIIKPRRREYLSSLILFEPIYKWSCQTSSLGLDLPQSYRYVKY